jgi:CMP-2-keto-3-deoxyoctulosonic acid synthetase
MFVAKDHIDTILELFDDVFGRRTPIGLVNFRYLTLDQIFNVIGIKGYNDLRLPHYFSALTRKTLLEQLRSLENYLGIYGTDKVSDINAKKIDFSLLLTD